MSLGRMKYHVQSWILVMTYTRGSKISPNKYKGITFFYLCLPNKGYLFVEIDRLN
jgi:hypothetical protein